ncbi:chromosome segregation ATPase [Marmoricola sp. URHA0025 HA25]
MTELERLRLRVAELEAEIGEARAAADTANERVREAEAALQASYDALAAIGDPLFASTFEESRLPEVAALKRRLRRQRKRNRRLQRELDAVRRSRAVRWSEWLRRVFRRRGGPGAA